MSFELMIKLRFLGFLAPDLRPKIENYLIGEHRSDALSIRASLVQYKSLEAGVNSFSKLSHSKL
jgi:hypothetical protein